MPFTYRKMPLVMALGPIPKNENFSKKRQLFRFNDRFSTLMR